METARGYRPEESFALQADAADPLRRFRDQFCLPQRGDGKPVIYFCSHSLGLQPRSVRRLVEEELDAWAQLGVEAHFQGKRPWYNYQDSFREAGARLVGARPSEVVFMNGLTVDLHLMMMTFYRPTKERFCILADEPAFPSDLYALKSQLQLHGFDPARALLTVRPRDGDHTLRMEDVEAALERRGGEIALVMFNSVNFLTGQWYDIARITAAAKRQGCVVGFDLAHAVGNVPLNLHDWRIDFAVWCNYKYMNSGPGAVAGCFVHERHGQNTKLPRLAGWWGNDPATRFRMQLEPKFTPQPGAAGWQVSNPPLLSMTPLRASLAMFEEAGMPALRAKSERMTGYLEFLLDRLPAGRFEIITPRDRDERGCQLSLLVHNGARELLHALEAEGVIADFREPNVIRVAPVPLYNTYHEVWRFAQILARCFRSPEAV